MERYYQDNFDDILNIFCVAAGGGAFSVRMDEDFTLLYGSDSYYRIHEYTRESMLERIQNKCIQYIHPDDLSQVRSHCQKSLQNTATRIEWEMRIITGNQNIKWIKCAGATSILNGDPVMHGFALDITEQKKLEEENQINRDTIQVAIAQTNLIFWTYDLVNRRIIQDIYAQKIFSHDLVIENVPHQFYGTGFIHPDDEPTVQAMFNDLIDGKPRAESVARWRNVQTGEYWWAKILYTTIYDAQNKAIMAIGSAIDVSNQMDLQKKYESQMSYKSIVDENIMGSFRLNLTQNQCGEGQCVYPYILKLEEDGTVDGFFSRVYSDIPDEAQRIAYAERFHRKNLIKSFDAGVTHLSLEHKFRVSEFHYEWIVTHVNITQNPMTGDIEALIYTFNIHQTKLIQQMMEHTVEQDYDYIALVNIRDERHIEVLNEKSTAIRPQTALKTYSEITKLLVEQENLPEDQERIQQERSLKTVVEKLEENDTYTVFYEAKHRDDTIHQKRLRFSYLDKSAGLVAFSATDITAAMEREQRKNELLNTALTAAKQANSAKIDFLSRMSHEIRTPMNAIIGMTAIGAQCIGDDQQVADCFSKIGISSRFLLSLINDILDMSRIESGKVLLKSEKVPFAELITSINSICYAQARANNIDYECTVDSSVEENYIGDTMKLQQVMINILSNAIKFTGPNGKVSIDIKQLKRNEHNATLRITVNDTGCGISEDFIPHMFEPFSQDHSSTTSMYSGTGLGLAICKNLVELMDGRIDVRSIVGVGTEFTVTVKLGITEETKANHVKKMSNQFDHLRALVVDDDVTVCQYTMITLKEIGLQAEWVDSGRKAIEQVKDQWAAHQNYDLILLDWKMPDMDGIETAREIRKIVGPDVTIIIMTAYDWVSIEHEAKLAGVNLLISKPLFKSTLISAFHKAFNEKQEKVEIENPPQFDFDGKRVLLVEDHPMNVEVARRLLLNRGFQVECAENGLRAIEMVTLSEDGYYDAILMDIRMPVMDGLQASQGIRNLQKKFAKTIPIIAMTANAFDDDIEKSRKAGMNAHLAKPIDPTHLYGTLYHYIYGESEEIL